MQNIIEILKGLGVEIPEDKQKDLNKAVAENYKTIAEVNSKSEKASAELTEWKERAEKAEAVLANLGDDPEQLKTQLEKAQQDLKDAQKDYELKLQTRDFEDLLKSSITEAKGKNAKAIRANLDIETLMKSRNQKADIDKAIADLKEAEDTSFLFTNEQQQAVNNRAAVFTSGKKPGTGNGSGVMTKDDIMNIKNASERQAAIREHMDLFE